MKFYQSKNVYDAAIERIQRLFEEFPEVVVNISGGKDSTVVYHLCLEVARQMNRLPLKVMFIDQEAEWEHTIKYVRGIMKNPDVEPIWFQMPIRIFNATSHDSEWLWCWKEGESWMRDKEPGSITENNYGTDRFAELFVEIINKDFAGKKACYIAGLRTEEAPKRAVGLTTAKTYKDITWGKVCSKKDEHYIFYPIFDWSYTDVWKFIHSTGVPYNKIYDFQYRYGINVADMRVSNLHHETSLKSLEYLQEIEPKTWEKLVERLPGVNTQKHLDKASSRCPDKLPFMFESWIEYRDYLLDVMIADDRKKVFRDKFLMMDKKYEGMQNIDDMYRVQITAIIINDYHMTKINNFERRPELAGFRLFKKKGIIHGKAFESKNKYLWGESK